MEPINIKIMKYNVNRMPEKNFVESFITEI
jgi:hypothetical protein